MILENKVALITGASHGIGAAAAYRLAEEGCDVIVNYNSDDSAAAELANRVEGLGRRAFLAKADLTSQPDIDKMFDEIRRQVDSVDILVSNVGKIEDPDSIVDAAEFRKKFELNLFSHVEVIRQTLPLMDTGKIVFTSSVHGGLGRGNADRAIYSATKAAMNSYMANLARHLAPDILVNAVAPGRTLTPGWGEKTDSEKEELARVHLTGRWIMPEEVADAIAFLIKNDSMCGQVLTIDGGMSLTTLG